ncbi:MAG: hypothetical protein MUE52_00395 [Tabrizicola sp.]|jgi:hypothetical protein|nr:hypothetical protein [Tabrizicola sp.]
MTQPWLGFVAVTLGLIQGGGVEVIQAPVRWLVSGLDAPMIVQAQTCIIGRLING